MRRAAVAVVLALLAACTEPAPEPLPEPPPPPPPAPIRLNGLRQLQGDYEEAHARYLAYQRLPTCAPSGVVPCRDLDEADRLRALDRRALAALANLERSRHLRAGARSSIEGFGAAAKAVRIKEFP